MAVREKRGTDTWSVAEAKAKFSEVIERATHEGPQRVTKNGRDAVVVVSAEEWEGHSRKKRSLADFFRDSPLRGSGIDLERVHDSGRKVDL
jgi:prevent-host-death family protein